MKKFYISVLFLFALSIFNTHLNAQVAINTTGAAPNGSAMLDVSASDAGILIPHVSLTGVTDNTTISSPANGLMIFHTGTAAMQEGFYFWSSADGNWKLLYSGNVPTVPGNTVYWVRPTGMNYIQPEGNQYIRVNDAGETHGIYYDGSTNQYGIFSRTTDNSGTTAAVVGFSDVASKQTYGYLGFNGTWTAPTDGFGGIEGAAVYGMVDDADRVAGFFRTTSNASYAANIAYSDVWTAGFYYIDNNDNTYRERPTIYGQSSVNCDQSGFQNAVKGFSGMKYNSNSGYTVGGSFIALGNQDQIGTNDGQDAIGVYGYSTSGNNKSSYGAYCRGDDVDYNKSNDPKSGIGVGAYGSMIGTWSYGELYGINVSGDRYGLYVDGKQFTNNIITQLSDNGNNDRTATYVPTSTTVDIIAKGTTTLTNGKTTVVFDKNFSSLVSETEPIIITVTPQGKTQGVYVDNAKNTGFVIMENNDGKSNTTVNWIAIGTKKGYETPTNPTELLSTDYDANMNAIYTNPVSSDQDYYYKSMYWDGTQLKFISTIKKASNPNLPNPIQKQ